VEAAGRDAITSWFEHQPAVAFFEPSIVTTTSVYPLPASIAIIISPFLPSFSRHAMFIQTPFPSFFIHAAAKG